MVPLPAPTKIAAAVKAMTALGAMFAIAWAASSGPLMTPCRRPASAAGVAALLWVVDMALL